MIAPCQCGNPKGYEVLGHKCVRCYRDQDLYTLQLIRDKAEIEYNNMDSLCYRIEVYEGLRPPPSDRPTHDVQGEPAMGNNERVLPTPMKQVRRSIPNVQEMSDE